MRMRILRLLFVLLLSISSISHGEVVNSVVALVGNIPITSIDFASRKAHLEMLAKMEKKRITDKDVYDDLITERVLHLKAQEYKIIITNREVEREMDRIREANKIPDMKTFESLIKQQGMDIDEYKLSLKKQIIMQNLYGVAVRSEQVSDAEADAYYAKSKGDEKKYFELDTSVQVGWIFFSAKTFGEKREKSELAAEVRAMASKGQNFANLARSYSDDARTKNNGGNLGYYMLSDLNTKRLPTHVSAALRMANSGSSKNAVSAVNESVGQGFWIIKILDIKKDQDSIRRRVKNYLSEKNVEKSFANWIQTEKEKIPVKTF